MSELFSVTASLISACMIAMWLLSLALRDASIVDIFWGPGFVAIAWASYFVVGGEPTLRTLLLPILVSLWGLRLGGYLLWRNAGAGEDARYVAMRRHWGKRFAWMSLFSVFCLQGVLMWLVSLPLQLGQLPAYAPLGVFDILGIVLFAFGWFFETLGDWQLARFKADPFSAGRVMDRGLWRYTRHPNYFGDFCVWWGLYLLVLGTTYGRFSIIGPALMTFLLTRVSGVPLLERSIHKRRPDYVAYVERTSAFFPRRPKHFRDTI